MKDQIVRVEYPPDIFTQGTPGPESVELKFINPRNDGTQRMRFRDGKCFFCGAARRRLCSKVDANDLVRFENNGNQPAGSYEGFCGVTITVASEPVVDMQQG